LSAIEWAALPLLHLAGSKKPGDEADEDVRIALERGLKVYYRLEDVPAAE
jgi:hypothetical protein